MRKFWVIVIGVAVAGLVGVSLVNQHRRPETLGRRVARELASAGAPMRVAATLVDFVPPAGSDKNRPKFEKKILWRNGQGVLKYAEHRDAVLLQCGDVQIYRFMDDEPVTHQWVKKADQALLIGALRRAGFVDNQPQNVVREAKETWLARSDEEILQFMLAADEGGLIREEQPQKVTQMAFAMLALNARGAVGVITTPLRTVYVFQEAEIAGHPLTAECRWVAFNHKAQEECYGIIRAPREEQESTLLMMWQAVRGDDFE